MDVSFYQDWVTFYPPGGQPLTMKTVRALRLVHASLTEEGITVLQSIPLGEGVETVLYSIRVDCNVFAEIIAEYATRIYKAHFLYEELKISV